MQPTLADIEMLVTFFVGISVVLTLLGLFAVLWRDAWLLVLTGLLRGATRLGLYEPSKPGANEQSGKRDSVFLAYTAMLAKLCEMVPGDPNRHPHTIVIPITVTLVPLIWLSYVFMWVGPFYTFGYVTQGIDSSWSTVAGYLAIFIYVTLVFTMLKFVVRLPRLLRATLKRPDSR